MIIRRLLEHFKVQNWVAIALDLLVVIVGIVLAFQVDRWYEGKRQASEEHEYLLALSDDFAATRDAFVRVRARHVDSVNAALKLLEYQLDEPIDLSHDEFYQLLADVTWMRTADARRGSYDFLISSGKIAEIRDAQLRSQMSEFYARFDGVVSDMNDDLQSYWRGSLEPYLHRNIDHVALMQRIHPRDNMHLMPTYPMNQFHDVLGTGTFEGLVSDKWHLSGDLINNYDRRIREIEAIELLIRENLSRFDAQNRTN